MSGNNELATVAIRCIPDNPNALSGVQHSKKARFDIETKSTGETTKRTPINLALILDRSGSMESDNKLTFAKKAISSVLNLLHDDDIVHLVAYDTDVSIIFENTRQAGGRKRGQRTYLSRLSPSKLLEKTTFLRIPGSLCRFR